MEKLKRRKKVAPTWHTALDEEEITFHEIGNNFPVRLMDSESGTIKTTTTATRRPTERRGTRTELDILW